jgi:hypothetical protein
MTTKADLFPSKYLKAADLGGKPWTMKIKAAPVAPQGSARRRE